MLFLINDIGTHCRAINQENKINNSLYLYSCIVWCLSAVCVCCTCKHMCGCMCMYKRTSAKCVRAYNTKCMCESMHVSAWTRNCEVKTEKKNLLILKRGVPYQYPGHQVTYLCGATWLWLLRGVPPSPSTRLCTELHTRLTPISSTTATVHHNSSLYITIQHHHWVTRLMPISSNTATVHHNTSQYSIITESPDSRQSLLPLQQYITIHHCTSQYSIITELPDSCQSPPFKQYNRIQAKIIHSKLQWVTKLQCSCLFWRQVTQIFFTQERNPSGVS